MLLLVLPAVFVPVTPLQHCVQGRSAAALLGQEGAFLVSTPLMKLYLLGVLQRGWDALLKCLLICVFALHSYRTAPLSCSCRLHSTFDAAQVDSALAVVRGVLAGKSLNDALVATRQHSASEYQYQFVKARNDYLQQARPAPRPQGTVRCRRRGSVRCRHLCRMVELQRPALLTWGFQGCQTLGQKGVFAAA